MTEALTSHCLPNHRAGSLVTQEEVGHHLSLLGDAGAIYLIHSVRFTGVYSGTSTKELGGEQDITLARGPYSLVVQTGH